MQSFLAQRSENVGPPLRGIGPLGLENQTPANAPSLFNKVLSTTIGVLTIVAAIIFIFQIISGAISWMGAGGDKGAIEEARKRITNGIIGLIIVIAAIFIAELIGSLLGLDLILNPGEFINQANLRP